MNLRILSTCTSLSDTDIRILLYLAQSSQASAAEFAKALSLSNATAQTSLLHLIAARLAVREREPRKTVGRPRYLYFIASDVVAQRLRRLAEECCEAAWREAEELLEAVQK